MYLFLCRKKGLLKEGRLSREERRKKRRSLKLAKKKAALSQKKEEREPDRKALMRDSMEKKVERYCGPHLVKELMGWWFLTDRGSLMLGWWSLTDPGSLLFGISRRELSCLSLLVS